LIGAALLAGGFGATYAQEVNPWLIAFPENEAVEGWEWPEGATVYLTIDNAPEGFIREGTAEVTSWGDPRTYVRFDFVGAYDLKIGDVVTLSDGTTTIEHLVRNLAITGVDMKTNTVAGTADPGAQLQVWVHEQPPLDVQADDYGIWLADFTGVYDIVLGTAGRAWVIAEGGNATAVGWSAPPPPPPPPTPWLIAFPENDAVEGWEWPEGATVYLTIDNAPGLEWSGIAAVTTWGDPRTYVRFDFADAYDLKVGDIAMLTDGMTVRQHTVKSLFVTDVDADKDEISGKAGGDETVYVWPHGAWFEPLHTTAHSITGNWQVDFTDVPFDLAPGMSGRSQILDEAGNATAVDWYAQPRYTGHFDWVIQCGEAVVWQGQFDYFLDIATGTLWDGANTWYLVGGQ